MCGRTTFVIAHRLATVQRADRIVVLDRGQIVEQGAHAELLQRQGLYRELFDLQFGGAKGDVASAGSDPASDQLPAVSPVSVEGTGYGSS